MLAKCIFLSFFSQKNVVAIVTDGAANMIGKNNGMVVHLRALLDKPHLIAHHCLAHRYYIL